jgi:hypothetical protein
MYIIADNNFEKFCVLFFEGLTPDDFFPPATGSRGKSRMNKSKAMNKVHCLIGDYKCHNDAHIAKIKDEIKLEVETHRNKIRSLWDKHNNTSIKAIKKKEKIEAIGRNEFDRHVKKINKLTDRINYWKSSSKRFKFIFEKV